MAVHSRPQTTVLLRPSKSAAAPEGISQIMLVMWYTPSSMPICHRFIPLKARYSTQTEVDMSRFLRKVKI